MGRSSSKKVKKNISGKPSSIKEAPRSREAVVEEKPFDFGGIPARDLKKNLGCG